MESEEQAKEVKRGWKGAFTTVPCVQVRYDTRTSVPHHLAIGQRIREEEERDEQKKDGKAESRRYCITLGACQPVPRGTLTRPSVLSLPLKCCKTRKGSPLMRRGRKGKRVGGAMIRSRW
jgi:hypothetical protein